MIQRHIDLNTAFRHLTEAHNDLKSDVVLPNWSVYRSLIPRALCNMIVLGLEESAQGRSSVDRGVGGVRIFDKDTLLLAAFSYAMESFVNQKSDDFRRGDLSLRSGTVDLIGDIERVLLVFCLHYKLNGVNILVEMNEHKASSARLWNAAQLSLGVRTYLRSSENP